MLNILTTLTDLIAPPSASVLIVRKYQPPAMSQFLSPQHIDKAVALAHFHSPVIHAAVVANKFHNYEKASKLLAALLSQWLSTLPATPTYLVPIPLGPKRQKERGYNQVERIIRHVTLPNTRYLLLLRRVRDTVPQTDLSRTARIENTKGAFAIEPHLLPQSGRLVLVDDVLTTGATLRSAAAVIAPHLPKNCELLTVAIAH